LHLLLLHTVVPFAGRDSSGGDLSASVHRRK
jgi:hypothetical protein